MTAATSPLPARLLAPFAAVSRPLTGLFIAMVVLAAAAVAGLFFDPRVITGAPAWLKPLKFAISTGIYALSFALLLGHVRGYPRLTRAIGTLTAVTLGIELLIINLQAARGTTSHYNLQTLFDGVLFQVMGAGILAFWICQLIATVVLLQQKFDDPVLAWSLRLGMALTAIGAAVAYLMVLPHPGQLEAFHGGGIVGAHTIGGADGGAGLPFTNWSRDHGDLRAAHFLGLHALQIIPLVGWLVARFALQRAHQVRLVLTAAASYAGLLGILVWQALRGQSVAAPDATTKLALAVWLAGTVAAGAASLALRARATMAVAL